MAVVPSLNVTGLTALSGQVYLFQIAAQADFGNAAKEEKIMRKLNCRPGNGHQPDPPARSTELNSIAITCSSKNTSAIAGREL